MAILKEKHAPHAVLVPFSGQGHVNALMNLAQLLALRGFFITFVNTEFIHKRLLEVSRNSQSLVSLVTRGDPELEQRGWKIRFLSIPGTSNVVDDLVTLQKLGPALEHLLLRAAEDDKSSSFPPITCIEEDKSSSIPPITCIVSDCIMMSCTEQVATSLKVPRAIFWPTCAVASISVCYSNFLLSEGHIPVNVSEAKNPEKLITCLPGNIPPLRPTDLPSFYRAQDPSDILFNAFLRESEKQFKADYVLVNTFEELEGRDAVKALSLNGCPALAIGPLFLSNFSEGRDSGSSLWEEEGESCLKWLDTQLPGSVIYISFGSVVVKSQTQLEQLALGLEASGQPFLWVLRLDIVGGQSVVLPEGFEERTKDRALFVKWAPQLKVLGHSSVGLFLTHGGWNSILESMSMGVPVVGFPHFADQFLNCRFAKEVWKIGLEFEDVEVDEHKRVRKEEVEEVVRRMMANPEGKQLRDNVIKLKDSAWKAVLPGGSSTLNINTFVEDMTVRK